MTQAITRQQTIIEQIQTLTPQQQKQVLDFINFLKYQANKPEIEQPPIELEPTEEPISFYEAAKEFIGCVEGGPGDLATNKDYLRGIGRK